MSDTFDIAVIGSGPGGYIAAELGVTVQSVSIRRSGLIKKGMIWSPNHGETAFTVPLFDQYMKRTMGELHE
jgi:predicted transcriptional regulator